MLDLIVRDFQAVKEVKLRIKGFTVLKGPSNSGKSSTIKAFYAATHNRFGSNQVRVRELQLLGKAGDAASDGGAQQ